MARSVAHRMNANFTSAPRSHVSHMCTWIQTSRVALVFCSLPSRAKASVIIIAIFVPHASRQTHTGILLATLQAPLLSCQSFPVKMSVGSCKIEVHLTKTAHCNSPSHPHPPIHQALSLTLFLTPSATNTQSSFSSMACKDRPLKTYKYIGLAQNV